MTDRLECRVTRFVPSHRNRSGSEYSEKHQWRGLLERILTDTSLLPLCWTLRRRQVLRAIDRDAADLQAITTLFQALGEDPQIASDQTALERRDIERCRQIVTFLDNTLLARMPTSTVLPFLAQKCCLLWLSLEARFIPDERGWLADLRDQLMRAAQHREIDLRGLDL